RAGLPRGALQARRGAGSRRAISLRDEAALDAARLAQDLLTRGAAQDRAFEAAVVQRGGDPREQREVPTDGRAHDREDRAARLPAYRTKVHGLIEEAKRARRPVDVETDGVADVGDRDALADPGRAEGLPGEQEVADEIAIRRVDGHSLDHSPQD